MPFGLRQSPLYAQRGNYADGMGIRNRSREQYHSASGNPNLPIFNTPQSGMPAGPAQTMQAPPQQMVSPRPGMPAGQPQQMQVPQQFSAPTNEQLYAAQQQQSNFIPQFNSGAMAPAMGQGSFGNIQQFMGQPRAMPQPQQPQQMQVAQPQFDRLLPQFRYR